MHWKKVTIVGVGLLGGSVGMALKRRQLAGTVAGYVRRPAMGPVCLEAGAIDEFHTELGAAVAGAELIVLCTPIARMKGLAEAMLDEIGEGTLVTDVGSVKGVLEEELGPLFGKRSVQFIGSHPMAGSEKTGVGEARPDLFEGATCVVTPRAGTDPGSVERLEQFWASLGGRPLVMSPEIHDTLVARSSHLPHLVAGALAKYVLDPAHPKEQRLLCASGFRDTTRIASGSVEMWRDICMGNREAMSRSLTEFMGVLEEVQKVLESGDEERIRQFLEKAKDQRDGWKKDTIEPGEVGSQTGEREL